ncbi:hypothetical protein AB0H34_20440 [Saccharopolyspora shandongensis]
MLDRTTDVVVGNGLGGVAVALALLRAGRRVVLTAADAATPSRT